MLLCKTDAIDTNPANTYPTFIVQKVHKNVVSRGMNMKKTLIKAALVASFLSVSGCSTYNSIVPEWAQIGSSGTESETEANTDDDKSVWWNPFSWF